MSRGAEDGVDRQLTSRVYNPYLAGGDHDPFHSSTNSRFSMMARATGSRKSRSGALSSRRWFGAVSILERLTNDFHCRCFDSYSRNLGVSAMGSASTTAFLFRNVSLMACANLGPENSNLAARGPVELSPERVPRARWARHRGHRGACVISSPTPRWPYAGVQQNATPTPRRP